MKIILRSIIMITLFNIVPPTSFAIDIPIPLKPWTQLQITQAINSVAKNLLKGDPLMSTMAAYDEAAGAVGAAQRLAIAEAKSAARLARLAKAGKGALFRVALPVVVGSAIGCSRLLADVINANDKIDRLCDDLWLCKMQGSCNQVTISSKITTAQQYAASVVSIYNICVSPFSATAQQKVARCSP